MSNRMLWLLSYVGLGLAFALGNRPLSVVQDQKRNQNHGKMVGLVGNLDSMDGNALHLRAYRYDDSLRTAVRDWFVYDSQSENNPRSSKSVSGNDGVTESARNENELLDDLFSTALKNVHRNHDAKREAVPFVYEEAPFFGQHRTRKRPDFKDRRVPGSEVYDYVEAPLITNRFILENRFDGRSGVAKLSFKESGNPSEDLTDLSRKVQGKGAGSTSSSMNLEVDKSLGKRNMATSGHREAPGAPPQPQQQLPSLPGGASIASQFMLRSARGNRQYDVPQIECPSSEDGMERFACPTPDRMGRYRCIDDHVLCDGFIDCPTGEDEDRQACMFYKTTKAHLDVLADALLRWARGR
ncbi:uncharacterized protein LOC117171791 [Belonocnema kinseyi]|uniref:uncharacterized protein LOC117171791 n=1 Tax=Belonocnema kinseyi TaxID=2817044 RepID=UPI00143DDDAD|nr:uncharacterized protein LOC117171791 [Belonocnema kinseyi]